MTTLAAPLAPAPPAPAPAGTPIEPGEDRPLRILMVAARYLPDMGGIETHVREVGRRLAAAGHAVTVLTADRTRARPPVEAADGMLIRRVPAWPRGRDYYWAPGIWREVMRADCDLLHVQGCHTLVPPLAMLAALRRRLPFVITFHSGGHSSSLRNRLRGLQWALLGGLVRRATRRIAVSRFEADLFSARMRFPRDAVSVVSNGAQLPAAKAPAAADPERPLIVSIGRLERYKGHHRAIEAMPDILAQRPGARLRVLGEGPYQQALTELADRLGIADRVEIGGVPPAERERLAALLGSAALVVLLSEYEAHPVAVLEALALGLPVLVTDSTGFMEMAEEGMVATVRPAAGSTEIAQAVLAALTDNRAGRAAPLPDWQDCADRLLAVYRSATKGR
ncbi:glycosyltransferase family 4 protein [Paracraurococcus lichenis]|uniref:Glycosyltransferase family 4 protein n=1 Tax=Paracraurococcus lichenis TaxID=3064888 RepID=A0ABT9E2J7_9PROT|nr:glycosyltransferase family 4 protein [Paracraurococcus sp. LOR1-02]MDO9710396.1 glycosyltransferase family 4 protein [Paracraurococcus sp. LOR1-02]